jgi:hypothetical protein
VAFAAHGYQLLQTIAHRDLRATAWWHASASHGATDTEHRLFGSACRLSDLHGRYSADDIAAIVAASTVKPQLGIAKSLSALLSLTAFLSLAAALEGDKGHVSSAGTDMTIFDGAPWCCALLDSGLPGKWRLVCVVDRKTLAAADSSSPTLRPSQVTVAFYIRVSSIDAGPELAARSMQAQLVSCVLQLSTILRAIRDLDAVAEVLVRPVFEVSSASSQSIEQRPMLAKLLTELGEGSLSYVIAASFSR